MLADRSSVHHPPALTSSPADTLVAVDTTVMAGADTSGTLTLALSVALVCTMLAVGVPLTVTLSTSGVVLVPVVVKAASHASKSACWAVSVTVQLAASPGARVGKSAQAALSAAKLSMPTVPVLLTVITQDSSSPAQTRQSPRRAVTTKLREKSRSEVDSPTGHPCPLPETLSYFIA